MDKKKTYRVTLDFSRESQGYIEDLQARTSSSTKAEVFKQALNVFDFIVDEIARGNKFIILSTDGSQREVVFPPMISKLRPPDKPK